MAHLASELVHLGAELYDAKDIDYSWCISNPANTPKPRAQINGAAGDPLCVSGSHENGKADTAASISLASTPAETPSEEMAPTLRRQVDSDTSLVPSTRSLDTGSTMVNSTTGLGNGPPPPISGTGPASKMRQSGEAHRSLSSTSLSLGSQHVLYRHPSGGGSASEEGAGAQWNNAFGVVADGDVRTFAVELTKMQWKIFVAIRVSRPGLMWGEYWQLTISRETF